MRSAASSRAAGRVATAVAIGTAITTLLAACGSSSKPTSTGGGTTPTNSGASTTVSQTYGQGVTATTIKLGIVMVDYKSIAPFIDFSRGDQQKVYQAFIDDINAHGGIGGKKIVPTYDTYVPIGSVGPTQACTKFTEDDKVFATIGVLIDQSGASQLCFVKQHHSILITHELSEATMKQSPPGLLLTTDALAERTTRALLTIANKKGLFAGKKFGIVAETSTKSRINAAILPTMHKLGIQVGTAGTLTTGNNPDTTEALAQLSSLIERWKGEGVNAVFVSGLDTISKAFVEKIKQEMPNALLVTDADSSGKAGAQDEVHAGKKPNPYEGLLALTGLSDEQQFETPKVQACVKVWEQASGTKVVAPKDLKPGPDGKRAEIYITVQDACGDLTFFKLIADKVGPYLNNANWTQAVDNFGSTTEMVSNALGSLGPGKYDAANQDELVEFDSSIGDGGDWKALTPLGDITKETNS